MKKTDLNRRDFNRLSMAAFGGVVAGSLAGCGGGDEAGDGSGGGDGTGDGTAGTDTPPDETPAAEHDVANILVDNHVCRGLNTCMNKGASGENACAGQGDCATAAHHTCHYENECKGQGGCGEHPGQNACEGKGECAVPLGDDAWAKARAAFEEAMTAAEKTFGSAPAAAEG